MKVSLSRHDKAMRDLIYQRALEGRLSQRTEEAWVTREKVRQQFVNIIRTLEKALQAKNVYTEGHSRRVAEKSIEVAKEMAAL